MSTDGRSVADRCAVAVSDLDEAIGFLKELSSEKVVNNRIREALLIAAIIAYGRAFTKSHGYDDTNGKPMSPEEFKFFDESDRALHEKIMIYRHEVVAHSDISSVESKIDDPVGTDVSCSIKRDKLLNIDPNLLLKISEKALRHYNHEVLDKIMGVSQPREMGAGVASRVLHTTSK